MQSEPLAPNIERKKVLVVEDVRALSIAYSEQLTDAGYDVVVADSAAAADVALSAGGGFAAVVLDLHLPDADGLEVLAKGLAKDQPVVVVTDDGSIARAVEAMRLGARDYLVKPVSLKRLVAAVDQAVIAGIQGEPACRANWARAVSAKSENGFVGNSKRMRKVYQLITQVADSPATVMITGETGTGKELCAERLHLESQRAGGPFVAINCGAIPDNLLESELFGHKKGAFTGATADRDGAVKSADKGTLFLDEICEMPLHLQVKLLRFLQTGTVQPLGSSRSEKVDVRVVCATNRDPRHEVATGRFREDLYFRLAVIPIEMPPLRERDGDIRLLAERFLAIFDRELGQPQRHLAPAFVSALEAYSWPGNVRELQNAMLRATLLSTGPDLSVEALQLEDFTLSTSGEPPVQPTAFAATTSPAGIETTMPTTMATLAEIERSAIEQAMQIAEGNAAEAAQLLGISTSTIYRKLKGYSN